LFVRGTVANQGRFYHCFDAILLLTAPIEVIFDRLHTRTNNPFGKTEAERRQIADDIANVAPLLRQAATHEIGTNRPLTEVADTLMDIAQTTDSLNEIWRQGHIRRNVGNTVTDEAGAIAVKRFVKTDFLGSRKFNPAGSELVIDRRVPAYRGLDGALSR
jgi:hypothetical protein